MYEEITPYLARIVQILDSIYALVICIAVITVGTFIHNMLRSSITKIRGDRDNE